MRRPMTALATAADATGTGPEPAFLDEDTDFREALGFGR